jgi:hypothetical protein
MSFSLECVTCVCDFVDRADVVRDHVTVHPLLSFAPLAIALNHLASMSKDGERANKTEVQYVTRRKS